MKFLLMALLLSCVSFSQIAQAQEDDYSMVGGESTQSSDEIYIPQESDVVSEEPIILDESDSQEVDGAAEYDY